MPKQKIINYFLVFPNENAVDQWLTANSLRLSSISTIIWHGNTHINGAVRAQYEELAKKVNLPPDKVEYALTYEIPKDENELWKRRELVRVSGQRQHCFLVVLLHGRHLAVPR